MDRRYLYLSLALFSSVAFAYPQASATGADPAFPTMSAQDGVGVAEGGVGSTITTLQTGNQGSGGGTWSLSTGGIVGICVGIAIVVLLVGCTWYIWYMAKKRQWKIRESIKRASRRMTGRKNPPRTPRAAAPSGSNANRRGTMYAKMSDPQQKDIDLEKGVSRSQKPSPGWLAQEKERSRSRSPSDDVKDNAPQAGGILKKLGFAKP